MAPDRYIKVVLTVIAAALIGHLLQNMQAPSHAQLAGCGTEQSPCWVAAMGSKYPVAVINAFENPLLVKVVP